MRNQTVGAHFKDAESHIGGGRVASAKCGLRVFLHEQFENTAGGSAPSGNETHENSAAGPWSWLRAGFQDA